MQALVNLHICADLPEISLVTDAISTKILCTVVPFFEGYVSYIFRIVEDYTSGYQTV